MAALALYTDEDVTDLLARALRARGFDVVSAHENDTQGEADADQLVRAASQQRAFLTFNVRDFVALHARYLAEKRDHAGIIVSTQLLLPELLRRTLNLLNVLGDEDMRNRLEWLNSHQ